MGPPVCLACMARDRPLWLVMVAVLLTCSAVRGAGTALTPAPFLKQRSSSSSTYSSPTSRHSSVQAIGPAPFGNHASHVSGKSSRSLHGATQESADGPAPAADSAHKQLLPLSARDVLFFLLAAGTLSLAAASGIGKCSCSTVVGMGYGNRHLHEDSPKQC